LEFAVNFLFKTNFFTTSGKLKVYLQYSDFDGLCVSEPGKKKIISIFFNLFYGWFQICNFIDFPLKIVISYIYIFIVRKQVWMRYSIINLFFEGLRHKWRFPCVLFDLKKRLEQFILFSKSSNDDL